MLRVSCKVNVKPKFHEYSGSIAKLNEALSASLTLQEIRSIHDSMNIPKIEFIS